MVVWKMVEAWRMAANELRLNIEVPFFLSVENRLFEFPLHIKDFGGKKGMLVLPENYTEEYFNIAREQGYFYSALSVSYNKYNRELFIETLEDWGYFGDTDNKPNWYNGHLYH